MEPVTAVHVPQTESADAKPSRAEILRGFINEKLTTAAQEIFAVVERTITGYEEEASGLRRELEQQRKQMETVVQPQLALCRLDEGLQYKIKQALPELHEEAARTLSEHLQEVVGVRTAEDLLFVEPDDIRPFLTPIQSRKLIKTFSKALEEDIRLKSSDSLEAGTSCSPAASLDAYSPGSVHSAQSPLQLLSTQPRTTRMSWICGFQIPWEKMPATLSQAIAVGVLPQPEDRRKMIRIVVEAMRLHCPNPNLAACTEVARMIVSQFPTTFADKTADDEQLGCGYFSILKQLKTRVEYVNRYDSTSRIRQPKKRPNGTTDCGGQIRPVKRGRSVPDRYGCINWQPTAPPEGETSESLEAKRQAMLTVYRSAGPQAVETAAVAEHMALTFMNQRQMINSWPAPGLCEVQEQWPFLFTTKGLCSHFHSLTGVEVASRLSEALQTKGRRLWDFFQSQRLRQVQEIERFLCLYGSTALSSQQVAVAVILLAMKYFQDREDSIFILADASSTKASVEMGMALPATPRLVMIDELRPLPVYAEVPVEAEQRQHTYAAGSQDVSGHSPQSGGDCEEAAGSAEEPSQGSRLDQNPPREPSHLVPNTGAQSVRTTFTTLDPLNISVCLLDPVKLQTGGRFSIRTLLAGREGQTRTVLNSCIRMMTCPRGLKEDDFLAQLRSTFPQLTRPFEAFTIDASRKQRLLKTESLTPENIYKNMESAEGGSTLYIHLKAEDQQQSVDETRTRGSVGSDPVEKVERKDADVVSVSSGTQQVEMDNDDGESSADCPDAAADSPASPGCSDAEDGDGQTPDHHLSLVGGATNPTRPSPSPASSAGDPSGRSGQQDRPSGLLTCPQPLSTKTQASRQLMVCLLKDARISTLAKEAAVSSQSFLGHAEKNGGNDGALTAEAAAQNLSPDQDTRKPAQLIPPTRDQCERTRVRKRNHLSLRVCLMKDVKSRLVKSPIQVVRCHRSMTEDSFLARLRATFPHFTGPFEAFTTDVSKKLLPLKPKALTPDNVYKSIKSTGKGRSALYIRVQQTCENKEKKQQDSAASSSIDSAADGEKHLQENNEEPDSSFLSSVMRCKQVRFRVGLLKDKATDILRKGVVSSVVRNLKCPRGMDEDAFLKHLRSTFPRLTGPFDAFTTDTSRKLIPLRTKTMTPENIYTAIKSAGKGRSALYIRAKPADRQRVHKELCPQRRKHEAAAATNDESGESKSICRDPVETVGNKEVEAASSSSAAASDTDHVCAAPGPSCSTDHSYSGQNLVETGSLSSGWKRKRSVLHMDHTKEDDGDDVSDEDLDDDWKPDDDEEAEASSSRATRRPLHIRVCLLNVTQTNVLSTKGNKCRVQKLRCPRNLRRGSFLDMLRSGFPALPKGDWPFDAFLTDKHRRLQRLEVKDMTPEEIYRSMKASGNGRSALYIQRKLTKPSVTNKEHNPPTQRRDGATRDALSSSDTREAEDEPHASSTIGLVGNKKSSEDLQPNSTLQTQEGEAQESPSVSVPPSAPESDDDVDWKPNQNDEEQEQSEPDRDLARPVQRSKRRRSASVKSPPEKTADGFYSCKACGSLHRSVNILLKHAWSHVDNSEKLCGVCGAPADDAEELRRHLDAHMKTHACSICGRYFLILRSLKKHMALHSREQPFKCTLCPKAYTSKNSLAVHSWTHAVSKPYKCDVCHQSFGLKTQMEAHATTHTGEKPYRCGVCGKTFTYFKCLSLHRSVHTSQKCHACQVCGKRFGRLEHMKAHKKIHTARDKSFLCDVCCKTFCSLSILKAHLKTHSGEEKTLCPQCGKELSSTGALRRHMIVHADQRPFSCSTCGRAFNAVSTLTVHMRTHTGEKRFTCKVCGKASSRRTHLQIHMRTHNGERPYKCSICPKDFTQSHCLKTHMKSHHVEKQ